MQKKKKKQNRKKEITLSEINVLLVKWIQTRTVQRLQPSTLRGTCLFFSDELSLQPPPSV